MSDNRVLGNPGTDAFHLEKYPFYLMNRIVGRFNVLIQRRLKSAGIDIPYWRVLLVLGEQSPRSVGQIADATLINGSTMMRIVQRMQRDRLVLCSPGRSDRRITDVALTATGRRTLRGARVKVGPIYSRLINEFSSGDFDQLLSLLGRLQSSLDATAGMRRSAGPLVAHVATNIAKRKS
jgi:DNA-binding MarR family transcriptional regulator